MGLITDTLLWFDSFEKHIKGNEMLELGDQFLYIHQKPYPEYPEKFLNPSMNLPIQSKQYFSEIRKYNVTCIDMNGANNSIPIDLCSDFSLDKKFDVITDYGTSEHVENLYKCLYNLHNHSKIGTIFFHSNPLTNNWIGHGNWYRGEDFYIKFCEIMKWELLDNSVKISLGNNIDGRLIHGCMKRTNNTAFMSEKKFNELLQIFKS